MKVLQGECYQSRHIRNTTYLVLKIAQIGASRIVSYLVETGPLAGTEADCSLSDFRERIGKRVPSLADQHFVNGR